jgi:hypothetical protein
MTFTTTCPACQTAVRLPWEYAGAEAECGRCGAIFDAHPHTNLTLPPAPPRRSRKQPVPADGAPVVALMLGLFNLVLWACPFIGIVTGIMGLVFGHSGLQSPRRALAVVGIVFSVVGLTFSVGWGALIAILMVREADVRNAPQRGNNAPFFNPK